MLRILAASTLATLAVGLAPAPAQASFCPGERSETTMHSPIIRGQLVHVSVTATHCPTFVRVASIKVSASRAVRVSSVAIGARVGPTYRLVTTLGPSRIGQLLMWFPAQDVPYSSGFAGRVVMTIDGTREMVQF